MTRRSMKAATAVVVERLAQALRNGELRCDRCGCDALLNGAGSSKHAGDCGFCRRNARDLLKTTTHRDLLTGAMVRTYTDKALDAALRVMVVDGWLLTEVLCGYKTYTPKVQS